MIGPRDNVFPGPAVALDGPATGHSVYSRCLLGASGLGKVSLQQVYFAGCPAEPQQIDCGCTGLLLQQIQNPTIFRKSGQIQLQISSRISWVWEMPVQLQYVQLVTANTNTVYLSSGVFAILISVTRMKKIKFISFHTFHQNLATAT